MLLLRPMVEVESSVEEVVSGGVEEVPLRVVGGEEHVLRPVEERKSPAPLLLRDRDLSA